MARKIMIALIMMVVRMLMMILLMVMRPDSLCSGLQVGSMEQVERPFVHLWSGNKKQKTSWNSSGIWGTWMLGR